MSGAGEDVPPRHYLSQMRRKKLVSRPGRGSVPESTSPSPETATATPPFRPPHPRPPPLHTPPDAAATTSFYPYSQFSHPPQQPYYYQDPPTFPTEPAAPTQQPASSPTTGEQGGCSSADGRIFLEPEGETFFLARQAVHRIVEIIRSRYDAPYVSWKKIPQAVRDMWFEEFEKDFTWDARNTKQIRKNFERRGSARMSDMFGDMRKSGNCPPWLGENLWEELNVIWKTPDFIKKSAQSKQNRASDADGEGSSLHTGGAMPLTEHRRILKKKLGREPTALELHERTHKHQDTQEWVDSRAREAANEYTRVLERHSQSASRPPDYDMWTEAVGGKKKGRIYGLGAEGAAYEAHSSQTSSTASGGSQSEEIERLRQQMQVQMDAQAAMQEQMAAMQQQMERMQRHQGKHTGGFHDQDIEATESD